MDEKIKELTDRLKQNVSKRSGVVITVSESALRDFGGSIKLQDADGQTVVNLLLTDEEINNLADRLSVLWRLSRRRIALRRLAALSSEES